MVNYEVILKQDSPNLEDYTIDHRGKRKIFCPYCLSFISERAMRKHFTPCTGFSLEGPKLFEGDHGSRRIKIIRIQDDYYLRMHVNKLKKMISFEQNFLTRFKYSKSQTYVLLKESVGGRWIKTIGLASIIWSNRFNCYILTSMIVYPLSNRGDGLGTFLLKCINEEFGMVLVESPNKEMESICDKFGNQYY